MYRKRKQPTVVDVDVEAIKEQLKCELLPKIIAKVTKGLKLMMT
jgi:hypothetical protein